LSRPTFDRNRPGAELKIPYPAEPPGATHTRQSNRVSASASAAETLNSFCRTSNSGNETGIGPTDLHQQIMGAPKRDQPAFYGLLPVLNAGRRSQALGRDGAHGRERILDAMVHFFENELLQLVRGFTLLGVDAGLREQGFGVDASLFQQQPKAVIFGC
jgi:hypothetical protein